MFDFYFGTQMVFLSFNKQNVIVMNDKYFLPMWKSGCLSWPLSKVPRGQPYLLAAGEEATCIFG